MTGNIHVGDDSLLLRVRGAFTAKGTSLAAWCRDNGVDHAHAHRVLRGRTNGRRALILRETLVNAADQGGEDNSPTRVITQ